VAPVRPASLALLAFSLGALLAAPAVPLTLAALRRLGQQRVNFEGRLLVNSAGLALLPPLLLALAAAPGSERPRLAGMSAALVFALLGWIDDRWGDRSIGGLRGHFRALAGGRLTTGGIKALGGAAAALGVAATLHGGRPVTAAWAAQVLLSGGTIALTANALNLFDLRPLRALKVFALAALPLWLAGATAGIAAPIPAGLGALLGAGAVYARWEARREAMLGDAGANLLGALLGLAAASLPWSAQAAWVAALLALHAYSERHSISAWIQRHPLAAALDRWGWGP
jgi:hypothetical protein